MGGWLVIAFFDQLAMVKILSNGSQSIVKYMAWKLTTQPKQSKQIYPSYPNSNQPTNSTQHYVGLVFLFAWLLVVVWIKKCIICSGIIFDFGEWGERAQQNS